MTRDEVIAVIRLCARKVGGTPTLRALHGMAGFNEPSLYQHFDGIADAVAAAGLKPARRIGRSGASLLMEWAGLARKLKRLPSAAQYRRLGPVTTKPLVRRFGKWANVPEAFRRFVRAHGMEGRWADVLQMIAGSRQKKKAFPSPPQNGSSTAPGGSIGQEDSQTWIAKAQVETVGLELRNRRARGDRPVYGDPLALAGLGHAPVNEAGVVYLFALVARRLGFVVERMQAGFPDCEALLEVEPGRWQRVSIEFEYASRNFARHAHRAQDCDVVVCWVHDWSDCPRELEVVELRKVVGKM